ncbi:lateral signaling target protein 2 homolog isoform X3 [Eriocheir sinensis]|uniref:lateral signaling target protein 2 homolog isoform X3 n=1 Tax=Eriocheir sinensis TaxID=95602 RepID=UPI0021C84E74|nr:lateral signaling target protein 2 homolog isoform X3 [Eriocheir sinensis]
MNSLRKWFYRPRKDDHSLMAQFYYADEELNLVAAELDSFDGRKDPERCTALVNQLRHCQDRVLNICIEMMDEVIPSERAARDFRVKFPDDVMQENLAGQLWFGAECLAAGSSIMNREAESSQMRPLAKAVTKTIETVRNLLREQCLKPVPEYTEKIRESLKIFDRLFAEFELNYVSAMVPVKTVEEHDVQQSVVVLFSETVQRALKLGLTSQDQVDDYDPALMFTIPRLAIVAGLIMFPDGPLNLDREPRSLSELFRPFRTLLTKIRELLWTMTCSELAALEKALCSMDEPDPTSAPLLAADTPPSSAYGRAAFTSDFVQKFYANHPSCRMVPPELGSLGGTGKKSHHDHRKRERTGKSRGSRARARQERQSERFLARLTASGEERPRARRRSRRHHHPRPHPPRPSQQPPVHDSDSGDEGRHSHSRVPPPFPLPLPQDQEQSHQLQSQQPMTRIKTIACSCGSMPPGAAQPSSLPSSVNSAQSYADTASTCDTACDSTPVPGPQARCPCPATDPSDGTGEAGTLVQAAARLCVTQNEEQEGPDLGESMSQAMETASTSKDVSCYKFAEEERRDPEESCERDRDCESKASREDASGTPHQSHDPQSPGSARCSSGSTSPYNSGAEDDEEVALALQAAEVAATWRARARFTDTQDLIHRLFVCISGVADQLQTNYASDLRKILKCVFLINQSPPEEPLPPPKGLHRPEENEEEEEERQDWSASSPIHSYGEEEEGMEGHSGEGNDIPSLSATPEAMVSQAASPPLTCPPSIQVPAAIFNDHALMQFSEVTQASVPPNVELLPPTQVQYAESFAVIPEPFTSRSSQEQQMQRDEGIPVGERESGRRRGPRLQEPPPWVPDQQAPRCMACGASFTMVRRRHHCRNCGKVFCAQCSQHAVPLPHYGIWKAVRVCNVCFLYYVTFTTDSTTTTSS